MDLRKKSVKIYRSRVHNLMDFAVSDNGEVPVCINVSFIAILATLALPYLALGVSRRLVWR